MNKRSKLPAKPSKLIAIALRDLRTAEKSKHFVVDMGEWYRPSAIEPVCAVCLGGSVLVGQLKFSSANPVALLTSTGLPHITTSKIAALDLLRCGYVERFIRAFFYGKATHQHVGLVRAIKAECMDKYSSYEEDPGQFKRWLKMVQVRLEKEGL